MPPPDFGAAFARLRRAKLRWQSAAELPLSDGQATTTTTRAGGRTRGRQISRSAGSRPQSKTLARFPNRPVLPTHPPGGARSSGRASHGEGASCNQQRCCDHGRLSGSSLLVGGGLCTRAGHELNRRRARRDAPHLPKAPRASARFWSAAGAPPHFPTLRQPGARGGGAASASEFTDLAFRPCPFPPILPPCNSASATRSSRTGSWQTR